jgi:prefoldin subunit 5
MSNEKNDFMFIAILVSIFIGTLLGLFSSNFYYDGQLGNRDTELGEYRDRVTELEQQYSIVTEAKGQLESALNRRADIERRTAIEVQGIGETINGLQLEGQSIATKLRGVIDALKAIQECLRNIENIKRDFGK